jgi:2-methylcitrate dehydratase PrpD
VRRLRHITDVEVAPEFDEVYPEQNGCEVIVTLQNGAQHAGRVAYAKGEPEFRMSEADLRAKFAALTARILRSEQAEALHRACMALDQAAGVEPLLRLTGVATPATARGD